MSRDLFVLLVGTPRRWHHKLLKIESYTMRGWRSRGVYFKHQNRVISGIGFVATYLQVPLSLHLVTGRRMPKRSSERI